MIIEDVIHGKIVPYTRQTRRGHFTKAAKRYHASQDVVMMSMIRALSKDAVTAQALMAAMSMSGSGLMGALSRDGKPYIMTPFRFGLSITAPPVKSGPNKGHLPSNAGDYDNFVKAFLDAAKKVALIPDDSLRWYRGPTNARRTCGVYIDPSSTWSFHWTFAT